MAGMFMQYRDSKKTVLKAYELHLWNDSKTNCRMDLNVFLTHIREHLKDQRGMVAPPPIHSHCRSNPACPLPGEADIETKIQGIVVI